VLTVTRKQRALPTSLFHLSRSRGGALRRVRGGCKERESATRLTMRCERIEEAEGERKANVDEMARGRRRCDYRRRRAL